LNIFNRLSQRTAAGGCAILLCISLAAGADEIQDIRKLLKQGKQVELEQALTRVNDYLVNKPKDAQALFLKGLILTDQKKNDEAIKVFSGLTEDYPELPQPYNNLAVLYANQGQYDKARVLLEIAIRTDPNYAAAHENLGDIHAKMARQAYERALQLDHGNTGTQTKLAKINDLFSSGTRKAVKHVKASGRTKAIASAPETKAVAPVTETPLASPASASSVASETAGAHKPVATDNSNDVLKKVHE